MTNIPFSALRLSPEIEKAIDKMGFEFATPVQSQSIPLIRSGADVIARSQTGTGKTIAFAIPAIEIVDTDEVKSTIQVLVLCPTRELAQQAADEFRKVARFNSGIRPVEIYGGAAIDKQCIRLRNANIVIGTPGRVMDHMRRKTIRLSNLKMIVLDEADEMLNMGFKEDIETILTDTPTTHQTVLFSATMPPAIMALTNQFQNDPQLIEINKSQVTAIDIEQSFIDVPFDRKKDALGALIQLHQPNRALIFCNTKKRVDDLTAYLCQRHFRAESIHSDIKQGQRTTVMQGFKNGNISILIATDIAARGIDVNDIDVVINFDVPQNKEYYIHRIGRTGRAGKSGKSITLCSGRREISVMRGIAQETKSEIHRTELPSSNEIKKISTEKVIREMEEALKREGSPNFCEIADQLAEKGHSLKNIAAAAMQLYFKDDTSPIIIPPVEHRKQEVLLNNKRSADHVKLGKKNQYETICINIGSTSRVAANHIVGAIVECTSLTREDIGKVRISPDQSVVEIPERGVREVMEGLRHCKICGKKVRATTPDGASDNSRSSKPRQGSKSYYGRARKRNR